MECTDSYSKFHLKLKSKLKKEKQERKENLRQISKWLLMKIVQNWLNHPKTKMTSSIWRESNNVDNLEVASGGIRLVRPTLVSLTKSLSKTCVNLRHLIISWKSGARFVRYCLITKKLFTVGNLTYSWIIPFGCFIEFVIRAVKLRAIFWWDIVADSRK